VKKALSPEYLVKKGAKLISFNLMGFLLFCADLFKIIIKELFPNAYGYVSVSPYLWSVY
jgi:hypothetical protein